MEDNYQKALEVIFSYSYGCCAFKQNICGDHSEVSDGMPDSFIPLPPEFFVNPRCPPVPTTTEDTTAEAHMSVAAYEPKENIPVED